MKGYIISIAAVGVAVVGTPIALGAMSSTPAPAPAPAPIVIPTLAPEGLDTDSGSGEDEVPTDVWTRYNSATNIGTQCVYEIVDPNPCTKESDWVEIDPWVAYETIQGKRHPDDPRNK